VLVPNYVGKEKVAKTAYMISTLSPTIPLRVDSYIPVPSLPFRRPTVSQVKEAVFAARKYLENVYTIGGEV
jgi:pyruvate-formate lyase-activating enzyme